MANARHKNTIYVDATGDITVDALKPILMGVILTPSAANSAIEIRESSLTGTIKLSMKIEATETRIIDLADIGGIELTKTFNITTLTNVSNMILIGSWLQPIGKARGL